MYATEGDPNKILARLNDGALVYRTPIPILLRCAAQLEGQRLPQVVAERLQSTLQAYQQQDSLILMADPAWNLRGALFAMDEDAGQPPRMHVSEQGVMVRFPHAVASTAEGPSSEVTVELKYNADFTVKLALQPAPNSPHAPPSVGELHATERWPRSDSANVVIAAGVGGDEECRNRTQWCHTREHIRSPNETRRLVIGQRKSLGRASVAGIFRATGGIGNDTPLNR